jgi:death-on-curing protein
MDSNLLVESDIIRINRRTITSHGGNFVPPKNILNHDRLLYLLEIVSESIFDVELYPTVFDKAGLYMHSIIANHIFQDGNKRTGLEAALLFLNLNGYELSDTVTLNDLFDFTIHVASGGSTLEEVQNWFKDNAILILKK